MSKSHEQGQKNIHITLVIYRSVCVKELIVSFIFRL